MLFIYFLNFVSQNKIQMAKEILMARTLAELVADQAIPVKCDLNLNVGDHWFDLDKGDYRRITQKVVFVKTTTGGLRQEGVCYIYSTVTP